MAVHIKSRIKTQIYSEVFAPCERLRELREEKGYTQHEIADFLGCTQVCYSNYELGKRDIPMEYLIALAGLSRVSVDYILKITDIKQRYPFSWK